MRKKSEKQSVQKSDPIPTRFDAPEDTALRDLSRHTGLPKSEIVRRAVKLLLAECRKRGDVKWILTELGPPLEFLSEQAEVLQRPPGSPFTKEDRRGRGVID